MALGKGGGPCPAGLVEAAGTKRAEIGLLRDDRRLARGGGDGGFAPSIHLAIGEEGKVLAFESEPLEPDTLRLERIMLGIRLNRGVTMSALRIDGIELHEKALQKVFDLGWIEPFEERLVLTPAGRHFCSEVALKLA